MRPVSAKRAAQIPERRRLREQQLLTHPLCEARIDGLCGRRATDVHELINRSQRATAWLEPELFVSLCRSCHGYVTTQPLWARKHGLNLQSWAGNVEIERARSVRGVCKDRSCMTDHMDWRNK
jgi:hypothetical protein